MSDYIELIKSRNQAIERAEKAEAEVERCAEEISALRDELDTLRDQVTDLRDEVKSVAERQREACSENVLRQFGRSFDAQLAAEAVRATPLVTEE
jgi:uncharacterized membrane protein